MPQITVNPLYFLWLLHLALRYGSHFCEDALCLSESLLEANKFPQAPEITLTVETFMDALTALQTRTSSPRLVEPGPTPEQMQVLLRSAIRAADHALLQPWRFIAIKDQSRNKLGSLFVEAALENKPDMSSAEQEKLSAKALRAPLILVVVARLNEHPKVPAIEQTLAAGAAAQNILLAAFAQNLGAVWRTGDMAYSETVKKGLGLDANEDIIAFIYLGTPAAPPRSLPEAKLTDFISDW